MPLTRGGLTSPAIGQCLRAQIGGQLAARALLWNMIFGMLPYQLHSNIVDLSNVRCRRMYADISTLSLRRQYGGPPHVFIVAMTIMVGVQ